MQKKVLILKHVNWFSIILFFFASFAFAAQELKVGFIQGRGDDAQVEEQAFKNAKIEFEVLDKGNYKIDTLLKYDVIAVGVVAYDKNEPLKENFKVVNEYVEKGGYLVSEEEKEKLKNTLWDEEGHLNTAIVAQSADKIAEMADINIPEGTEFYIVPETGWGPDHPFSGEKLSVVMALYKADDIDHAIELTNNIQSYQGQGHSCGIYSNSDENIMKLANVTKTSRVMVNQPQAASNSGNLWNGMRQTFSLGCGSWGGNGTNNNISWRDLINETWVSKPLTETKELRSDEELFGDVMDKIK